jgi:hypothetical protein
MVFITIQKHQKPYKTIGVVVKIVLSFNGIFLRDAFVLGD